MPDNGERQQKKKIQLFVSTATETTKRFSAFIPSNTVGEEGQGVAGVRTNTPSVPSSPTLLHAPRPGGEGGRNNGYGKAQGSNMEGFKVKKGINQFVMHKIEEHNARYFKWY